MKLSLEMVHLIDVIEMVITLVAILYFHDKSNRLMRRALESLAISKSFTAITTKNILGAMYLEMIRSMISIMGNPTTKIERAPYGKVACIFQFLLTKKQYQRIILPTITGCLEDYYDSLATNKIWYIRWVKLRGYICIVGCFVMAITTDFVKKVVVKIIS